MSSTFVHRQLLNKSTQKLIFKLCYNDYWQFLQDCEETGIQAISDMSETDKETVIRKYEDGLSTWRDQMKEWGEWMSGGCRRSGMVC